MENTERMPTMALFQFEVELDIGESYLYGMAKRIGSTKNFAINLQGGSSSSSRSEIVLPVALMRGLPYVNEARLSIRTESEVLTLETKLSSGDDMIEIYDDRLLRRLANVKNVALEISL